MHVELPEPNIQLKCTMNNFSFPLLYILIIVLFWGSCSKKNPDFDAFAGEWVGEYRTSEISKNLELSVDLTNTGRETAILNELGETASTKDLSFDGKNFNYEDPTTLTFIRATLASDLQSISGEFILGRNVYPFKMVASDKGDSSNPSLYRGTLTIPSQTHGVRVLLEESFTGNVRGTIDIPDLEIRNVPLDSIAFNAQNTSGKKSLFFASERLQLSYAGNVDNSATPPGISGSWTEYPTSHTNVPSDGATLLHRPVKDYFVTPAHLNSAAGIPAISPEKAGLSAGTLQALQNNVQADANSTLDAMLIYRNGKLVFEQYENGYSGNALHKLSGVSRSITALLTGIALRDSLLEDLHEPISSYLNVPKDSEQSAITLHQLMTMSSGLACNDWSRTAFSNRTKMLREKDWVGYYWRVIMAEKPGTSWSECGGNGVLLAAVLEKVSKMRFRNYLNKNLLQPLGIDEFLIEHDAFGDADGGSGISMSAYDLAKIGQLLLEEGTLYEKGESATEVIPSRWLETVWKEQFDLGDEAQSSYGYFWWTKAMPYKNTNIQVHYAAGMGGQYLMIIPELDMVCVFLATDELNKRLGKPFELLQNYILPAVVE